MLSFMAHSDKENARTITIRSMREFKDDKKKKEMDKVFEVRP